jgi:uncharacterized membrane protein
MPPWIQYTLARLGLFVIAYAVLVLVGTGWILGAVFATLIALALSVLLLGGLRQRVADDIQRRVESTTTDADSSIEDDQVDATTN